MNASSATPTTVRFAALFAPQPLLNWGGALAIALGLGALIGWIGHWNVLAQISPDWSPVRWNSAMCLVALGSAALALARDRGHTVTVLGSIVCGIGAATLL